MFGNYLGISGSKGSQAKSKYSRQSNIASPSTQCQRCLGKGHFTSDCKQPREYKVRPTRTQILKNPKLRTKLTESHPPRTEDMPKEGTAAAILAANEAKRALKIKAATRRDGSSSSSSSSGSSSSPGSSSSGSDSGSGSESESESDDGGRKRSRRSPQEDPKRRKTDDRRERRRSDASEPDRKGKGSEVERDA